MSNLILLASIDWEGAEIKQDNIDAIKKFNESHHDVPFTHFICPSYFTRGFDTPKISELIKSAIKPNDEIALHIHCWESLITAAGVTYHAKPTWNKNNDPGTGVKKANGELDFGHDVPLGSYDDAELLKIFTNSLELLVSSGLIERVKDCVGFRCGGWVASTNVLKAMQTTGNFTYDASGAPNLFFKSLNAREPLPLYSWLEEQWGSTLVNDPAYISNSLTHPLYPDGVTGLDPQSPTISQTQFIKDANLHEIPNTAALADYNTVSQLKDYIDRAVAQAIKTGNTAISMGFHDVNATQVSFDDPPLTNIEVFTQGVDYFKSQNGVMLTRKALAKRLRQQANNVCYRYA